ncbi:hypothetical protein A2572_03920 [Candidatus Collierbacteria bacterium RIFOXYD1_FULL_40_9]|uniref:Uncharacterized protein n=1 Tax=Candidatus Collierbacteria bacterium RIFOXYD1_FULL_40_9 TaxID=1817731 RepID=A0A1F5FW20_9BACT|nr:MAG: hypothetical protein A2572_03920 [Candidatus Collierbacteria bacterium RIFOXYD1_FULL_40_9]
MKLWIIFLIILSFLFWFILGKIWENPSGENNYSNKEEYFVFPTPKITTTDLFESGGRPTLVVTPPSESSSSAGVIRF